MPLAVFFFFSFSGAFGPQNPLFLVRFTNQTYTIFIFIPHYKSIIEFFIVSVWGVLILAFSVPRFFFSFCTRTVISHGFTIHALFTYCSHIKKILKIGLTILFTHLKIILLQYFQFSVFNFRNNKFNPNGP